MATLTARESPPATRRTAPLIGGLVALALAYGICVLLAAGGHLTFPDSDDGATARFREVFPIVEGAGAAVFAFQRVPVTVEQADFGFRGPEFGPNETNRSRVVVSPLGGLLLIGLALGVGGAVAHRRRRDRGALAAGASVAAVFTVACFVSSFLLPLGGGGTEPGPNASTGYTVTYHPSHWRAVFWPLIWGVAFGSLGAFIAKHGRRWRKELVATIEARSATGGIAVRAVSSGVAIGVGLVLLAAVLTAIVGTTLHRSVTADVLGSPKNVLGIAEGVVIGLPHATGGGLLASMGIPARYEVSDVGGRSSQVAQASIFSGRPIAGAFGGEPRSDRFDSVVPGYALGALLIAVAFTLVTGYRAASLSEDTLSAVTTAAVSGVLLTIVMWVIAYLFGVRVTFTTLPAGSGWRGTIAPSLIHVVILTPLWCVGGAMVGAVLRLFRSRSAA